MKKIWKYIAACAVVASLMPLTACDDDDTVDPYDVNYCYLYQPHTSYASLQYKATGDFISNLEDPLKLVPVRLTKPAPKDVTVTVALDESAVAEYNEANSTDYKFLEGAQILNPTMQIKAGEYISADLITVSFGDHSFLVNNTDNLILPIVIKDAQGLAVSNSSRLFLIFNYKGNVVDLNDITIRYLEMNWTSELSNMKVTNLVTSEWAADIAITVNLQVDLSLVEGYNATNGTAYEPLPGASVPASMTMAQGADSIDVPVTLSDVNIEIKDYLLPVKATAISGNGAELGNSTAYIVVKPTPGTCSYTSASALGSVISCDNWNMTVNGQEGVTDDDGTWYWLNLLTHYGDRYNSMIDYWYPDDVVLVDLGEEKTITGFECIFYAWYYSVTDFRGVRTSLDGTHWSDWGSAEVPGSIKSTPFGFDNPPTCRYIELTVGNPSFSKDWGTFPLGVRFYEAAAAAE